MAERRNPAPRGAGAPTNRRPRPSQRACAVPAVPEQARAALGRVWPVQPRGGALVGYGPGVCEGDERGAWELPGEECARRLLGDAREQARELCREADLDAAEEFLGFLSAGVSAIAAEARLPEFAAITDLDAFADLMLETDAPYYLGVSMADTITSTLVDAFEEPRDRVAMLEAAAAHIAEAIVRERAAGAAGES